MISWDLIYRERHAREIRLAQMFGVAPAHAADLMAHMDPVLLQMIHHQVMDEQHVGGGGWIGDDDDDEEYHEDDDDDDDEGVDDFGDAAVL